MCGKGEKGDFFLGLSFCFSPWTSVNGIPITIPCLNICYRVESALQFLDNSWSPPLDLDRAGGHHPDCVLSIGISPGPPICPRILHYMDRWTPVLQGLRLDHSLKIDSVWTRFFLSCRTVYLNATLFSAVDFWYTEQKKGRSQISERIEVDASGGMFERLWTNRGSSRRMTFC